MREQIKICDFTKDEIEWLLHECNFTDDERQLFDLRNKYYTLERCAEIMNVSTKTAYRINKRIKDKIVRSVMKG